MADFDSSLPVRTETDGDVVVKLTDGAQTLSINGSNQAEVAEANSADILTAVQLLDNVVKVDDAAFTAGTDSVSMSGFVFDDVSPDSVDEGDAGAARMSANRNIYTQIRDAAGNERGLNVDASGRIGITIEADNVGIGGGTEFAEDSAHSSGANGKLMLAVRQDTATAMTDTDGDYSALLTDANGRLHVLDQYSSNIDTTLTNMDTTLTSLDGKDFATETTLSSIDTTLSTGVTVTNTSGGDSLQTDANLQVGDADVSTSNTVPATLYDSSGTEITWYATEDTAHTTGDMGVATLAVRQDTLSSLVDTDGDYAPLKVNADGRLYVTSEGDVTQYAEDAAHTSGDTGTFILGVRQDTLASLGGTDGDYVGMSFDSTGRLYVTSDGDVTQYAEDAAHTSGDTGNFILAVRQDTLSSLAGTDGDYTGLSVDDTGRLYTTEENSAAILADTANIDTNVATIAGAVSGSEMQVDIVSGSVSISNTEASPIPVYVTDEVSGIEIDDYQTTASVAASGSTNHDYTVSGSTTFNLRSVIASGSGKIKVTVLVGPVASLATKLVFFNSTANPTVQIDVPRPIEVDDASTGTVRVTIENLEGSAQDVYSTLIGSEVAD